jgi:hypothetical protein
MKEIETVLKLPTSEFDYTSFEALVFSLPSSQGIVDLYQNKFVDAPATTAASAGPTAEALMKRRINLAWAVLLAHMRLRCNEATCPSGSCEREEG